jgi:hypothetical protein
MKPGPIYVRADQHIVGSRTRSSAKLTSSHDGKVGLEVYVRVHERPLSGSKNADKCGNRCRPQTVDVRADQT